MCGFARLLDCITAMKPKMILCKLLIVEQMKRMKDCYACNSDRYKITLCHIDTGHKYYSFKMRQGHCRPITFLLKTAETKEVRDGEGESRRDGKMKERKDRKGRSEGREERKGRSEGREERRRKERGEKSDDLRDEI